VKVPNIFPRLLALNDVHKRYGSTYDPSVHRFVWLEQVIAANLDLLFPGMRVVASSVFRVTRNNDIEIAEEEASDLLTSVEEVVRARRFAPVVRLDVSESMPQSVRDLLLREMEITPNELYVLPEPLGMRDLFELANIDVPALKYPPYTPSRPANLPSGSDILPPFGAAISCSIIPMSHSRQLWNSSSRRRKTRTSSLSNARSTASAANRQLWKRC
jgi:Polyphosphate kinase